MKMLNIIYRPAAEEIDALQAKLTFWRTCAACLLIIVIILTTMAK